MSQKDIPGTSIGCWCPAMGTEGLQMTAVEYNISISEVMTIRTRALRFGVSLSWLGVFPQFVMTYILGVSVWIKDVLYLVRG